MPSSLADRVAVARSLLFVPGHRPDRFPKADSAGADVIILDLEDAVPGDRKERARDLVAEWIDAGHQAVIRINPVGTPWHDGDLAMLAGRPAVVMLPKAETAAEVAAVAAHLAASGGVIPLIETAAGVFECRYLCRPAGVLRVAFGAVDLATQLRVTPESDAALAASRSALVLASADAGLPEPIDSPALDTAADSARLRQECASAVELGYGAKLCIHPRQVSTVNTAFSVASDQLAWARKVLAAEAGGAVTQMDGRMVDKPVFERARWLLRRAGEPS